MQKGNYVHKHNKSANRPLWRESLWGADWLSLRFSAIYYGFGAGRGDGSAVVVIPGFLGTDHYLAELYCWLRRVGYKPYMSGIGWNADCLNKLGARLRDTIDRAAQETGKPVHLIGHSLGGVLGRAVAAHQKESVASVIALGSPFRGFSTHPLVRRTSEFVRTRILKENSNERPECFSGYCGCDTVKAWKSPFPETVSRTAVYTKTDGVVDWRVCVDADSDNNYEVDGTHVGLVVNPQVYRIVAERLSASID
jgi:pimeloyl-ACP methyl ester carboxylesterase